MTKILLLHHRYTADDQCIWREAIKAGWRTERIGNSLIDLQNKVGVIEANKYAYYGNMLHIQQTQSFLPVNFHHLNTNNLCSAQMAQFVGRKIQKVTGEFLKHYQFNSPKFIKSASIKWIESKVYNHDWELNKNSIINTDEYYIQDVVNIVNEIRCFVINGEIVTASYYRINKEFNPVNAADIPQELKDMTREIWSRCAWPNGVVFDFALNAYPIDKASKYIFIEANEAYASGLYDCNPELCFQTVLQSQKSKYE